MPKKKSLEVQKKKAITKVNAFCKKYKKDANDYIPAIEALEDADEVMSFVDQLVDSYVGLIEKTRERIRKESKIFGAPITSEDTYFYKLKTVKELEDYFEKRKRLYINHKLAACRDLCYPDDILKKVEAANTLFEADRIMRSYRTSEEYDKRCKEVEAYLSQAKKKAKRNQLGRDTRFTHRKLYFAEEADAVAYLDAHKDDFSKWRFSNKYGLTELEFMIKDEVQPRTFAIKYIRPFFKISWTNDYVKIYKYVKEDSSEDIKSVPEVMPREDTEVPEIKEVK